MAKIKPMVLIESMSGKVCGHSDMSFVHNKKTGRVHTMKVCNPYEGPRSANQIAQMTKFQLAVAAAKAVNNATSEDQDQTNYQKKQAYVAAFKAQKNNPSLFSFIVQMEYKAAN